MTRGTQPGKRRKTFDRLVPESVRRELGEALQCESDPAARHALFDEHNLGGKYGVSRRQFGRFSDRFPCVTEGEPDPAPPEPAPAEERAGPSATPVFPEGYREWMTRAGAVLSTLARRLSADDPDGWERGVYLALLGRVFAVLAGESTGLPMHDVLMVSRILREHERARGRAGREGTGSAKGARGPSSRSDRSADALRDVVRELYGLRGQGAGVGGQGAGVGRESVGCHPPAL